MAREIKFRAWDNLNKCWFNNGGGFAIDWDATSIQDDNDERYNVAVASIILMQFTGLLDKNGKEIYEGDILKWAEETTDFRTIPADVGYVKWNNDYFRFDVNCALWQAKQALQSTHATISEIKQVSEVIGNIYENPDLLK